MKQHIVILGLAKLASYGTARVKFAWRDSFAMREAFSRLLPFVLIGLTCPWSALATGVKPTPDWDFQFDERTGDWLSLKWKGENLLSGGAPVAAVDVQVQTGKWLLDRKTSGSKLVRQLQDNQKLILTRQCEDWELEEQITFAAQGRPGRIERMLRLTYKPANPKAEPAKFHRARFVTLLPRQGSFMTPGKGNLDDPRSRDCQTLEKGFRTSSVSGVGPLLVQQKSDRTLLFINDARRDQAQCNLAVYEDNTILVANDFFAAGWALPNQPQTIGPAYLDLSGTDGETAMRTSIWQWYDDIGLRVPANRPAWVAQSVLYCLHPGGTIGSGFTDLGGFAVAQKELLPRIRELGCGAVWLLPLEDKSCYHPRDYYKFMPGLGTPAEYKSFVTAAHQLGLKVWQDLVPHGGSPDCGPVRGDLPWWLVFDEQGNAQNYWCFDFREPGWQDRIFRVADYYVREYGIDGFRVDAVGGSHIMNWRREGFPVADKTPDNVPSDWWRSSLAKVGGKVPALPYERGSLTMREGGMQMLHGIRTAVRKLKPEDGAVLAEVQRPPYMQECDVLYDFDFAHRLVLNARRMPAEKFVPSLQRFLEEQKYVEPRGTRRLRYVESHDTVRAQGWFGVDAKRALIALTLWVDGLPMLYHDADIGHGQFLKKVIGIRNQVPELQSGEAFYEAVQSDNAKVFTCLRTLTENASVVAINLSPEAQKIKLNIPWDTRDRLSAGSYQLWNLANGKPVATGLPAELRNVSLELGAWEPVVLCLRSKSSACPVTVSPPENRELASKTGAFQVQTNAGILSVSSGSYRLELDLKTGLVKNFKDRQGRALIGFHDLFLDADAREGESPIAAVHYQSGRTQPTTPEFQLDFKNGAKAFLTYVCSETDVLLRAALEVKAPMKRAGLVFGIVRPERYSINTAEGLLQDQFSIRHKLGKPGSSSIYYRPQGTEILWQATQTPLPASNGFLDFALPDHATLHIGVPGAWTPGLANSMLLDQYADQEGCFAAFMWRDDDGFPQNQANRAEFQISLADAVGVSKKPAATPLITHNSLNWQVENKYYRAQLLRTGGTIQALWSKGAGQRLVASDNSVYTDQGFRTERARRADAADDVETATRVWQDGESVRLRFTGSMRDDDRFGIVRPALQFFTEYVFDNSPSFQVHHGFLSQGKPRETNAFLAWMLRLPEVQNVQFLRTGTVWGRGIVDRKQRILESAKAAGKPLPDSMVFGDGAAETMLQLSDLQFRGPAVPRNVFQQNENFFIAWLDGTNPKLEPNHWYESQFTLTPGKAVPAKSVPMAWLVQETPGAGWLADASFESFSSKSFSVKLQKPVSISAFSLSQAQAWTVPAGGRITGAFAHGGSRCAQVENTTGEYRLFIQSARNAESLLGRKVRISGWFKGENVKLGKESWMTASLGLSYQDAQNKTQHPSVSAKQGSFDWYKVEGVLTLPSDARNLMLRAGLNGATGLLWMDDIMVQLEP
jgi:glycosidase